MTKIITDNISDAAEIIKQGGLVAVPTETVYGLACNGLNENSVKQIYEVKGRPAVKPLSLMVHDAGEIEKYCSDVPYAAKYLAKRFWPGPLTIVLKSKNIVPDIVRAGGDTLGLRCPAHDMTLEALKLSALPFAAPSANPSGEESPKNAQKVAEYFDGKIDAIIDGGECGIGRESTIIDMSHTPYRILREGALSREVIAEALSDSILKIGITGGSGCGKTSVLNTLQKHGVYMIDCDEVYRELINGSEQLLSELNAAFPGVIIDGTLDRKALGAIVFNDKEKLGILNEITHRHVKERVNTILKAQAMNGCTAAGIDAIELFSSGLAAECDTTLAVLAGKETRIQRIMARDNISRELAELRVNAQKSDEYFIQNCEHIIYNDTSLSEMEDKVTELYKEITTNG